MVDGEDPQGRLPPQGRPRPAAQARRGVARLPRLEVRGTGARLAADGRHGIGASGPTTRIRAYAAPRAWVAPGIAARPGIGRAIGLCVAHRELIGACTANGEVRTVRCGHDRPARDGQGEHGSCRLLQCADACAVADPPAAPGPRVREARPAHRWRRGRSGPLRRVEGHGVAVWLDGSRGHATADDARCRGYWCRTSISSTTRRSTSTRRRSRTSKGSQGPGARTDPPVIVAARDPSASGSAGWCIRAMTRKYHRP